jgi:dTDP-4-amino-4,6-dideoxy-D-galactose acyltransferase
MNNTQQLDWDSDILGLSVARILTSALSIEKLQSLLQRLKAQGVKLVYYLVSSDDMNSQKAAQRCGGYLVDKKVSYYLDLTSLPPLPCNKNIEIYTANSATAELEAIAIEIGQHSRFAQDPQLRAEQVNKLYKAWINNCCKKLVAKVVLVSKEQESIIGLVAIDKKHGRADLSLVGVAAGHQGQGIGKQLVYAAQNWSLKQGYVTSQVVTQKTNLKACRLYESCGYQLEKIEYFYHFWL